MREYREGSLVRAVFPGKVPRRGIVWQISEVMAAIFWDTAMTQWIDHDIISDWIKTGVFWVEVF